jgi:Raf kinase inhibitor-like YbhB/YbcL family protein
MRLESPAFIAGGQMPARFTRFEDNINPPFNFWEVPAGICSFTLIMDERHSDRETIVHWVVFNIDSSVRHLAEGEHLPQGACAGSNHWGKTGYHGPQVEGENVYTFRLFALDAKLWLPYGANSARVLDAMGGHIMEKAELAGIYSPSTVASRNPPYALHENSK